MSGTGAVCRFQQPILKTTNREPITAHASCLADVRVQPNGNPQAGSELGSAACRRTGRWPEISRVSDHGTSIARRDRRSEEARDGKEWVGRGRFRWTPYHSKRKLLTKQE